MSITGLVSFSASTVAQASQVNTNFNILKTYIESNCILADGSVAFATIPSGPSLDPSTDNQFARKLYVDTLVNKRSGLISVEATPANVTFSAFDTFTDFAEVSIVVPTNTNPYDLTIVAGASCEISNANNASTYAGKLQINWDALTVGSTYADMGGQISSAHGPTSAQTTYDPVPYTGLSLASRASLSAVSNKTIKVKFVGLQRSSFATKATVSSINLWAMAFREVPLV